MKQIKIKRYDIKEKENFAKKTNAKEIKKKKKSETKCISLCINI